MYPCLTPHGVCGVKLRLPQHCCNVGIGLTPTRGEWIENPAPPAGPIKKPPAHADGRKENA